MKTSRFILIGLTALVAVLAAWLQRDTGRKPLEAMSDKAHAEELHPATTTDDLHATTLHSVAEQELAAAPRASTLLETALALPSGFERQHSLEGFGFDAAAEGVDAALRHLAGLTIASDRLAFLRGMFARLSSGPPAEGMRALLALDEGIERETALTALVASLRQNPMSLEEQRRLGERFGSMGGLVAGLLDRPALAVEYARGLLSGMDRARVLSAAAARQAGTDPQLALSWGAGLEGKERKEFLVGFASSWARSAGEAAWTWSLQEQDPSLRQAVQAAIIAGSAANDPANAALRLGELAEGEARQRALAVLGSEWAMTDTEAAMNWANNLANPKDRETAAAAISQNAPVGIGVALGMGSDGYPVINELVPGGPASGTGALKDGYQIAAIGDSSGRFTELQGKGLGDVVSLIRGKAGSPVWLQVFQPGGNPANRTTVVITRQQILFKRPPGA